MGSRQRQRRQKKKNIGAEFQVDGKEIFGTCDECGSYGKLVRKPRESSKGDLFLCRACKNSCGNSKNRPVNHKRKKSRTQKIPVPMVIYEDF